MSRRRSRDDDYDDEPSGFLRGLFSALNSSVANNLIKFLSTAVVCTTTVALFAISSITRLSEQALSLPILAFGGLSTAAVWLFGQKGNPRERALKKNLNREIGQLRETIDDLEQRLANVETIESANEEILRRRADSMAREQLGQMRGGNSDVTISEDGTMRRPVSE